MKPLLEGLFYNYVTKRKYNKSPCMADAEIEVNVKQLKRGFNKKQKRLFLKIIDAKDLLEEESNLESFINGFKIGLQIGYESNKD